MPATASTDDHSEPRGVDRALALGPNTLLTTRETAEALRTSLVTLARWRSLRTGPAFVKISGNRVAYRAEDLAAYIRARRCAA